jgi:hypothetical protein
MPHLPLGKTQKAIYLNDEIATKVQELADEDNRSWNEKAVELIQLGIRLTDARKEKEKED